jgi:ectoine hydroxylase-related dioxygenase (phytanoyl-CoA dioxygenase family)
MKEPEIRTDRLSSESVRAEEGETEVLGACLIDRICEQGLEPNVAQLELQGYTVLRSVVPSDMRQRLRDGILALEEASERSGRKTFGFGPNTRVMYDVITKVPEARQALLNPSVTTLMTYLLGDAFLANLVTGSVFRKGCLAGPIHSDNEFQPEPFPRQPTVATAIWCCDEFTAENGATHIVPRSHRLYRHPRPGEGEEQAQPVVAPAGSIIVWDGATWHSSGAKSTDGERVVLHTSFCRLHVRSLMSFHWVSTEIVDQHPPRFAELLGLGGPMGFGPEGPRAKAMARAKGRVDSMRPWK